MSKLSNLTKSPFRGFSIEEVLASEAVSYVIQVGSDFFHHEGMMVFSKKTAITYYNRVLAQVVEAMHKGDKKERQHAHRVMLNLKILPLRIQ